MGIEKPNQFSATPGDKQRLVDLEEGQGHDEYSEIYDMIERDEQKAQTIIAQALLDKAVAERASSQDMGKEEVSEEAKSATDDILKKFSQKEKAG